MVEISKLDKVVKETISAIEKGKKQIFEIAEAARTEYERVKKELEQLQQQTVQIIEQVDQLERKFKAARVRLFEVSSNFDKYTEEDIKKAYEVANDFQVKLTIMRERETQAKSKRDELERTLKNLLATVEKAENLVSQVGVVLDFIQGSLLEVNSQIEDMQQKQSVGLRIIKAQEEERKRIAREIHDGPAQAMANVVLRVEFCEKLLDIDPVKVKAELRSLKANVRNALIDVRKIIFDLRPMALDDLGLIPALKRYLIDYREKYSLATEFVFQGQERRMASVIEVGVFRVIQEALNNVWKHAQASRVQVKVNLNHEYITVEIQDDGQGFNLAEEQNSERESLGLTSIQERADLLEGELVINTHPGRGTQVKLKVPVRE